MDNLTSYFECKSFPFPYIWTLTKKSPNLRKLHFSRKPGFSKMSSSSEELVNSMFSLYERWGSQNYIGEKVSQLQHAQQVHLSHYIWSHWEKILVKIISFLLFLKNIYSEYSDDVIKQYKFGFRFFPKGIFSSDHFL